MSETDEEFVERLGDIWHMATDDEKTRLRTLARRGAAVQWKPCCVCGAMQHWMPLPPPPAGETNE